MLPISVARSFSDMFTIGATSSIAGKAFSSSLKMHYRPGREVGVHSADEVYAIYDCLVMAALCNRGAIIFLPCDFYLSSSFLFLA